MPKPLKINVAKLTVAVNSRPRPEGCLAEVLALGTVAAGVMEIEPVKYESWRSKYALPRPPLRGLGDVVAAIAQPVAKAVDAALGTHIKDCGKCGERQDKLNEAVPFGGSVGTGN